MGVEGDGGGSPAVELEHAVGFSAIKGGLKYHPNEREYLFAAGASIIVCDFTDPHNQVRVRAACSPRGEAPDRYSARFEAIEHSSAARSSRSS